VTTQPERNVLIYQSDSAGISSKEVMARTGISRATLNNYIALNLIPPPSIRKPEEPGGPTKIGYFPEWVIERIERIRQLKAAGVRMSAIAAHLIDDNREVFRVEPEPLPSFAFQWIEQIVFPAILVNQQWDIIWANQAAEESLFTERVQEFPAEAKRNLFGLVVTKGLKSRFANWKDILTVHICVAKREQGDDVLDQIYREGEVYPSEEVKQLWQDAEPLEVHPFTKQPLVLKPHGGKTTHHTLSSIDLRAGTLLLYIPANMQLDQVLDLLMGRVELVKEVLSRRTPALTPLCILAGRLESDLNLRTTLPPSEYFALINQTILSSHQCFRQHGGSPGSSVHEGVVCFFLSAPDAPQDYLYQALLCAQALQQLVSTLDKRWKYKQTWNNTLRMNIGIHCDHEWLGTILSPLAFEFTVVGDTLMETIKLSEFSQSGAIWASKKVIENLLPSHRERVEFGLRLGVYQERFVSPGIYSPVGDLLSQEELERRDLRQINNLTVTEIINVHP
jgi:class 3 adenylate cyclase/DNA-binding transcriptional MerR regulator